MDGGNTLRFWIKCGVQLTYKVFFKPKVDVLKPNVDDPRSCPFTVTQYFACIISKVEKEESMFDVIFLLKKNAKSMFLLYDFLYVKLLHKF
jgi:hypothetical protein